MSADSEEAIAVVPDDDAVAARLLDKLRAFVGSLDDEERAVMAALLAPGVASAYAEPEPDPDVVGFGMASVAWKPTRLPDALTGRIRSQHLRVERTWTAASTSSDAPNSSSSSSQRTGSTPGRVSS
jgi:hypothetical protein